MWTGEMETICELSQVCVCVHIYMHLAKLTGKICLIPHLSLNPWSLFTLLFQSQPVWMLRDWAEVHAIICNCFIAAPLSLSTFFLRVPQMFFCIVQWNLYIVSIWVSSLWLYILLSALKPRNIALGLALKWFVVLCEQLSLPFYYVTANITLPREAVETSSDSMVFILADIVMEVYC